MAIKKNESKKTSTLMLIQPGITEEWRKNEQSTFLDKWLPTQAQAKQVTNSAPKLKIFIQFKQIPNQLTLD